jgi:riboflavin synthase
MFTGLIEQVAPAHVLGKARKARQLAIGAPAAWRNLEAGESIAVNGCCLTITTLSAGKIIFDLLEETLARTNLGRLDAGGPVNLERALPANGRLGGHFVQGHIDCTARVLRLEQRSADFRLEIDLPNDFARYLAPKGSIAVNGVSLTIAERTRQSFVVWIIPHTWEKTNLRFLEPGALVNLEFDILAKYVEQFLGR